jgi:hypothetical protein
MRRLNSRVIRIAGIGAALLLAPAIVSVFPGIVFSGVLPAITGLTVAGVSVHAIVTRFGIAQILLGIFTISLSIVSLWTLKRMFIDGTFATYLPYYGIAAAIPFAVIQRYLARSR